MEFRKKIGIGSGLQNFLIRTPLVHTRNGSTPIWSMGNCTISSWFLYFKQQEKYSVQKKVELHNSHDSCDPATYFTNTTSVMSLTPHPDLTWLRALESNWSPCPCLEAIQGFREEIPILFLTMYAYPFRTLGDEHWTRGVQSRFFRLRLRSCSKIFESGSGNFSNIRIGLLFRLRLQSSIQP